MGELDDNLARLLRVDGEGPAAPIDAAAAAQLLDRVLDQAAVAPVKPLRLHKYAWLLAAALVLGGSAAAMYAAQRDRGEPQAVVPPKAAIARPAQAPTAAVPTTPEPALALQPQAPSESAADAGAVSAPDLLARANRLRGEGRYRAAERVYLKVVAQDGSGKSAYAARVAAAALRQEHLSDLRGALALYAQALRSDPRGALTPEIHAGLADVYGKLGQAAQERRALQALLRHSPQGPAAERARRRLGELGPTSK